MLTALLSLLLNSSTITAAISVSESSLIHNLASELARFCVSDSEQLQGTSACVEICAEEAVAFGVWTVGEEDHTIDGVPDPTGTAIEGSLLLHLQQEKHLPTFGEWVAWLGRFVASSFVALFCSEPESEVTAFTASAYATLASKTHVAANLCLITPNRRRATASKQLYNVRVRASSPAGFLTSSQPLSYDPEFRVNGLPIKIGSKCVKFPITVENKNWGVHARP